MVLPVSEYTGQSSSRVLPRHSLFPGKSFRCLCAPVHCASATCLPVIGDEGWLPHQLLPARGPAELMSLAVPHQNPNALHAAGTRCGTSICTYCVRASTILPLYMCDRFDQRLPWPGYVAKHLVSRYHQTEDLGLDSTVLILTLHHQRNVQNQQLRALSGTTTFSHRFLLSSGTDLLQLFPSFRPTVSLISRQYRPSATSSIHFIHPTQQYEERHPLTCPVMCR